MSKFGASLTLLHPCPARSRYSAMRLMLLVFITFLFTLPGPAKAQGAPAPAPGPEAAQDPFGGKLRFPVDCTLGTDCWTVNYVDADPAKNAAHDFTCAAKTYDGHSGTDFAVRSLAEVKKGVNVLAARDGKVLRLRDQEIDSAKTPADLKTLRENNTECGNGVLLEHGPGLFTQYCHLKQGSVKVKQGQKVKAGEVIAQIGQSGAAEFPHVHFAVIWEDAYMDPYTGLNQNAGCAVGKAPLWDKDISYEPVALYDGGFSQSPPDFSAIEAGAPNVESLEPTSPALVFWIAIYGAREGDEITLEITGPDGEIFAQRNAAQDKTRARQYYYTGKKLDAPLRPGTYTGHATVRRAGVNEITITRAVQVK
jgi:murein DD-endopeptidase MepM/ murein hydrolase activator NlpD